PFLLTQAALPAVAALALLLSALAALFLHRGLTVPGFWADVGAPLSWAGWLATAATGFWVLTLRSPRRVIHVLALAGLGAGCLLAFAPVLRDPSGWLAYHVLSLSWAVCAFIILGLAWLGTSAPSASLRWRAGAAQLLGRLFPSSAARWWVQSIAL